MTATSVLGSVLQLPSHESEWLRHARVTNVQTMDNTLDKFPPLKEEPYDTSVEPGGGSNSHTRTYPHIDMWQSRPSYDGVWENKISLVRSSKHRSRKSISEAITTIRTRSASVSANAHELAQALKAPVSLRLVGLCVIWYTTSALTNTSSKTILNALPKPVTLTIVQFAFVSMWCLLLAYLSSVFPIIRCNVSALKNGILYPSREVLMTALPLAVFQLAGHILSSMATSQIPVSLVHTIKGLSPLFTVLAYRVFFRIRYAKATYLSLIPLTLGVMLACSTGFSTNFSGILCAFLAALVFVSQNIFSKRLFNEAARTESNPQSAGRRKIDKLNLLCYCSGLAFFLTLPIWCMSEGYSLISDIMHDGSISLTAKEGTLDHGALFVQFIFNGTSHFAQNILAFVLLSMISPVSYSVASLVKRVFVIVAAIVWFGSSTTSIQAVGIALTFLGLYLYDRNSHDDVADQRANADHFRTKEMLLPMTVATPSKLWGLNGYAYPLKSMNGDHSKFTEHSQRKEDEPGQMELRGNGICRGWLPPGTKQKSTWRQ